MTQCFSRIAGALCALGSLTSLNASANDLYLDINPDAFFARFDGTHSTRGLNLSASALITDDNGEVYSFGLFKTGEVQSNSSLVAGLGVKLAYIDGEGDDAQALAIGGSLAYKLPQSPQVILSAEVYYAPAITITDDLDGFLDFTARVNYQLFDNGSIYAGYRVVEIDIENASEFEIDESLHLGIQLTF